MFYILKKNLEHNKNIKCKINKEDLNLYLTAGKYYK